MYIISIVSWEHFLASLYTTIYDVCVGRQADAIFGLFMWLSKWEKYWNKRSAIFKTIWDNGIIRVGSYSDDWDTFIRGLLSIRYKRWDFSLSKMFLFFHCGDCRALKIFLSVNYQLNYRLRFMNNPDSKNSKSKFDIIIIIICSLYFERSQLFLGDWSIYQFYIMGRFSADLPRLQPVSAVCIW